MITSFISALSICSIITCSTPSPRVQPVKSKIVLSAPGKAKQGEKVWMSLKNLPINAVIDINFGDQAFTRPLSDKKGLLKTWHTYGCRPREYKSTYIVKVMTPKKQEILHTLTIICAAAPITPTIIISPSVIPTKKPSRQTPTQLPTRAPSSSPKPAAVKKAVNPTQAPQKTNQQIVYKAKTVFDKVKPLITYQLQPTDTKNVCSGVQVIVSTLLYGRTITLPYVAGPGPDYPVYDTKTTISSDQMFEYHIKFAPTGLVYMQEDLENNKINTFALKNGDTLRTHFYLQGFHSANSNVLRYTSDSPVNDDMIIQTTGVGGRVSMLSKLKNGTTCGLSFVQHFEPATDFLKSNSASIEKGTNPIPYQ